MRNSFTLSGQVIDLEKLPELIGELDLFPLLVRRLIEKQSTSNISPTKEEQTKYYQKFLKGNRIVNAEALQTWLRVEGITEQAMSKRLYSSLQIDQFKEQKFDHHQTSNEYSKPFGPVANKQNKKGPKQVKLFFNPK